MSTEQPTHESAPEVEDREDDQEEEEEEEDAGQQAQPNNLAPGSLVWLPLNKYDFKETSDPYFEGIKMEAFGHPYIVLMPEQATNFVAIVQATTLQGWELQYYCERKGLDTCGFMPIHPAPPSEADGHPLLEFEVPGHGERMRWVRMENVERVPDSYLFHPTGGPRKLTEESFKQLVLGMKRTYFLDMAARYLPADSEAALLKLAASS